MRTLHRLTIGLLALGFAVAPAVAAAAEPTPTPTALPCKAGSVKMTFDGDSVVVAPAAGQVVTKSGRLSNSTGVFYKDLALTFAIGPDAGGTTLKPTVRLILGQGKPVQDLHFHLVSTPRSMWVSNALQAPLVWQTGIPSATFRFEVSFTAGATVTTYSTKLTATAQVCGDAVLGSSTAMKFGFMTAGTPTQTASPKPRTSASAKPSRKPSATPQASGEEVLPPPGDETQATESAAGEISPDLAAGETGSSPLPWMAGLGVTALVVAGGLLWWVRRTTYDED